MGFARRWNLLKSFQDLSFHRCEKYPDITLSIFSDRILGNPLRFLGSKASPATPWDRVCPSFVSSMQLRLPANTLGRLQSSISRSLSRGVGPLATRAAFTVENGCAPKGVSLPCRPRPRNEANQELRVLSSSCALKSRHTEAILAHKQDLLVNPWKAQKVRIAHG